MTTDRLINWIDSHDRPAPTRDNEDGTITVYSWSLDGGELEPIGETIPATMAEARKLLGY